MQALRARLPPGHPWRQVARLLLPWVLLFGVAFPWLWLEAQEAAHAPLRRNRDDTLQEAVVIVQRSLDAVRHDTLLLADLASRLPLDDVSPKSPAAQLFLSFIESAGNLGQVRWLDEQGREVLRVTKGNGPARVTPAAELQDRSDRQFFTQAVRLPLGSVYFSALDLSPERRGDQTPTAPTVRAGTPLLAQGQMRGVVLLNYRAERLLTRLAGLGPTQGLDVFVVNPQGYWIHGPEPADDWAWQLGAPERTVARTHPALWQAMQAASQGQVTDASGEWVFRRIAAWSEPDADGLVSADALDLRILVRTEPATANRHAWRWQLPLVGLMVLAGAGALLLTLRLVRSRAAEDQRNRELRAAHAELLESSRNLQSAQAELARADRLSSLGLMVAGVAHELNTPLGSATLALSTVRQDVTQLQQQLGSGLRKSDLENFVAAAGAGLSLAQTALQRSAGLVQRFKQVAVDRSTMEQRDFDLSDIVLDADFRLRRWPAKDPVVLQLDLAPGILMHSFPGPLEQVVSNLLANVLAHAFAGRPGGTVTISAAADGPDHATVRVADDGRGVPEADLARIFDPFFTTRRHAGGSGLGLHIVWQIVTELLGGTVVAESVEGRGTVVTLRLPRRAPPRRTAAAERAPESPQGPDAAAAPLQGQ